MKPTRVTCLHQVSGGQQSEYLYQLGRDEHAIQAKVIRRRRKTLALYVEKDELPELRVPLNCPRLEIESFLASRFDWIVSAQAEVAAKASAPKDEFVPGGEISYLGRRYRLEVIQSRYSVVNIENDTLFLSCPNPRPHLVEKQVQRWFRRESERLFASRIEVLAGRFADGLRHSGLTIRKMKSRWGSCSSNGEITLNLLLIREHLPQIDFVIAHELCHLRHFAHNREFYRLMDQVMPDWRDRESVLGQGSV